MSLCTIMDLYKSWENIYSIKNIFQFTLSDSIVLQFVSNTAQFWQLFWVENLMSVPYHPQKPNGERNFFPCLQVEMISLLSFTRFLFLKFLTIKYFSVAHKLQFLFQVYRIWHNTQFSMFEWTPHFYLLNFIKNRHNENFFYRYLIK